MTRACYFFTFQFFSFFLVNIEEKEKRKEKKKIKEKCFKSVRQRNISFFVKKVDNLWPSISDYFPVCA